MFLQSLHSSFYKFLPSLVLNQPWDFSREKLFLCLRKWEIFFLEMENISNDTGQYVIKWRWGFLRIRWHGLRGGNDTRRMEWNKSVLGHATLEVSLDIGQDLTALERCAGRGGIVQILGLHARPFNTYFCPWGQGNLKCLPHVSYLPWLIFPVICYASLKSAGVIWHLVSNCMGSQEKNHEGHTTQCISSWKCLLC